MTTCADCGVEVEAKHTTGDGETMWGHRVTPLLPTDSHDAWDFCCRWEPGEERGTIKSADYHYVEGETQRHFRAP